MWKKHTVHLLFWWAVLHMLRSTCGLAAPGVIRVVAVCGDRLLVLGSTFTLGSWCPVGLGSI